MEKVNLIKVDPDYYKASSKPRIVELKESRYISLIGHGAPESERFHQSIEAIYAVGYTLKGKFKNKSQDFVVPKMEAFWWIEDDKPFEEAERSDWQWEILIRTPEFVDSTSVEEAVQFVINKKEMPFVNEIYYKSIPAHKCVQTLHIGSYEEEKPTIDKIFNFMEENQLTVSGSHREIYISDPRRTAVEKLKTILRYAVN